MKAQRGVWRFKFGDGSVIEVDKAVVDAAGFAQLTWALHFNAQRRKAASTSGGEATRDGANVEHKDLDDKILACWARGDETRQYVKIWAREHEVSRATVYRRIKGLKPK